MLIQSQRTQGTLKVRGSVAFVGFCIMAASNILISFIGSALYETHRPGWFRNDPAKYRDEDIEGSHVSAAPVRNGGPLPGTHGYKPTNYEAGSGIVDAPADFEPVSLGQTGVERSLAGATAV